VQTAAEHAGPVEAARMAAGEAAGEVAATEQARSLPLLAGRWEIDPSQPLPAYDRPSATAYAARDQAAPDRSLLAWVCATELPIRAPAAHLLQGTEMPGLLELLAFGPIPWPSREARRMVLIGARPSGEPIAAAFRKREAIGNETELTRLLLRPVLQGLMTLAEMGIAHRGIRPDNLWLSTEDSGGAVLGDALAGPAGYDQPVAYEPLDRACASPAGRGEGKAADDVFALGVTLLALIGRCDPALGRSDAALMQARLDQGSFAALTEGVRLPLPLLEPLRGMLADAPQLRWTLRDVDAWLQGRQPAMRVGPAREPTTPFSLAGERHLTARALAAAVVRHPADAIRAVYSGALARWVRTELHDPSLALRLAEATAAGGDSSGDSQRKVDALLAKVALLLDPLGPIRYRGLSFTPDGFGPALAHAVTGNGDDAQAAAQAIALRLPYLRETLQPAEMPPERQRSPTFAMLPEPQRSPTFAMLPEPQRSPTFAMLEVFLRSAQPGFGLERCLYEANPGLHCLSPRIRARCVTDLAELLPALEAAAAEGMAVGGPLDRHVVAFVAAHAGADLAPLLGKLADADPAEHVGLLAFVDARHPGPPTPQLAAWIGRSLPPFVAAFHNRETRAVVERQLRRAIARGDLSAMSAVVCDRQRRRLDRRGFEAARAAYARLEAEIAALASSEPVRRRMARAAGVHAAAMIACAAASASAGVSLLLPH
jgi:eukaryotic-like serine/threonine-protein kinase